MTAQEQATNILHLWQIQRERGIKPEARRLPALDADYERELAEIRKIMEHA